MTFIRYLIRFLKIKFSQCRGLKAREYPRYPQCNTRTDTLQWRHEWRCHTPPVGIIITLHLYALFRPLNDVMYYYYLHWILQGISSSLVEIYREIEVKNERRIRINMSVGLVVRGANEEGPRMATSASCVASNTHSPSLYQQLETWGWECPSLFSWSSWPRLYSPTRKLVRMRACWCWRRTTSTRPLRKTNSSWLSFVSKVCSGASGTPGICGCSWEG